MEYIDCIICSEKKSKLAITEGGYEGRQCIKCGLIFVSPRPTFDEVTKLYSVEKTKLYAKAIVHDELLKRLHARHTLSIIRKYQKSGKLLELGTGAGYFLDEARKKNFQVYGNELNTILANLVRNNLEIPCEQDVLNENTFGRKTFDIIYHCNVLSHLFDPIFEFKMINNKLNPGGLQIFETGTTGDMDKKFYKYIEKFDYPDHLFFFSENSVNRLLELTGFKPVKIYKYSKLAYFILLKYQKRLQLIFKKYKSQEDSCQIPSPNVSYRNKFNFNYRSIPRNTKIYLFLLLVYKIGYMFSKKKYPQTVIVVAQKK
jgi:SAM-dependent methyltransferase